MPLPITATVCGCLAPPALRVGAGAIFNGLPIKAHCAGTRRSDQMARTLVAMRRRAGAKRGKRGAADGARSMPAARSAARG